MEKFYSRALYEGSRALDGGSKVHTFVISTDTLARDDAVIDVDGWDLKNYKRNPVVLDSHNYTSFENILGTAEVRVKDGRLEADITFNGSPKGQLAEQYVENGNLRATSVAWLPKEWRFEEAKDKRTVIHFEKQELLEVSMVAMPSDPNALKIRAMLDEAPRILKRPFENEHACRLRDPGGFQDDSFRRTSRQSDGKRYDVIMGRLKGETTMTEQAYRYPKDSWPASEARSHCTEHDGKEFEPAKGESAMSLSDLWTPVAAAMVALMDSNVAMEETERKRIYQSLERIYRVLGREPPEYHPLEELVAWDRETIAGLFWEGEMETRKGRVLSRANEGKIRGAVNSLQEVLASLGEETEEERQIGELDLSALTEFTKEKEK